MKKSSRGMSLVETMLALIVTLGVVGGAMSLLMFMQKSARNQESRVSLTQEARFVLKQLSSELKNAGSMVTLMGNRSFTGGSSKGQMPFYGLYPLNNTNGPDGVIIASGSPYFVTKLSAPFAVSHGVLNLARTAHTDPNMKWQKNDLIMVISKQGYVIVRNVADQISSTATTIPVAAEPVYYGGLLNSGSYIDRTLNSSSVTFNPEEAAVLKLSHFGIYMIHDMDLVRVSDMKGNSNPFISSSDPTKDPTIGVVASNILDLQIVYRSFGDPTTFPNNIVEYFKNGPNGQPGANDGTVANMLTGAFLRKEIKEVEMTLVVLTSEFKSGNQKNQVTNIKVEAHGDRSSYQAQSNTLPAGSTTKKLPDYFTYRTYDIIANVRNFGPKF